ncbi:DUF5954 family protein [Actinocorallia sp. A-T 12471]|uniref:DUF5954 family protein n=1 Tax=Actinocorallia sp. A-T 12471 TaxID=3089813 RepID=UPI0029CD4B7F|nr:DUF5954 family protein [Actinocorallia sp. A-T 12471]MDX6741657.1 DUF5954 family protein [Actinocorallia sp. A-T 12471]
MGGYNKINLVADLDPAMAVRDQELGERMRVHPKMFPAGPPDFGWAVQVGREWRIGGAGGTCPDAARRGLAAHLRRTADQLPGSQEKRVREMFAVAGKLDPEEGEQLAKDEWEIGDKRFRIIRVEKYTLIGNGVLEPPRHTDTDPPEAALPLKGHPIDPLVPAGYWEAQLRMNLCSYEPIPGTVPEQIQVEARHAVRTHPSVITLPPEFTVVEIEDGRSNPITGGNGPEQARRSLANYFGDLLPRVREFKGDPASPAELARWRRVAAWIEQNPGPQWDVMGRRFRTVRVSRFLRLGRDGPESPRPSDAVYFT